MKMKFLAISLALLCHACITNAQTAEQIAEKYVDAVGGRARLDSLKTVYMEGASAADNGAELKYRIYRVQGLLLRREIEAVGVNSVTILTKKKGWSSDRFQPGTFAAMPSDQVTSRQYELHCINPLVNYKSAGYPLKLAGKEFINGNPAFKLELMIDANQLFTYFIDCQSYLLVHEKRLTQNDGKVTAIDYGNYQKNKQGYVFPMYITGRLGVVEISFVEVNGFVDPALFKP